MSQRGTGDQPCHVHGEDRADRVLPILLTCANGKGPDDLLFTTRSGHQLHTTAVKRTIAWSAVATGRRIHDLRHTATNIYLHHLGSSADAPDWSV